MIRFITILVAAIVPLILSANDSLAAKVSFRKGEYSLYVHIGGQQVAEYVFSDEQILRPYFRQLRTLNGQHVTRNSPPQAGDLDDHATMHPGLWLAFGDLSGADFWRNKAIVKHDGFSKTPSESAGSGSFEVRNAYEANGKVICSEKCLVTISTNSYGYLLDWTSEFRSADGDFAFGDQEEMGLGVRVATPLAVVKGGEIIDSDGRKNGKEVWGQQADWCRYGGLRDGRNVGVALMPDPKNFRRSWFHARDYGLLVANPFGRNAFTKGEKSSLVVSKNSAFRLRFGVLIYDTAAETQLPIDSVYSDFIGKRSSP